MDKQVNEQLKAMIGASDLTMRKIAERAGVGYTQLSRIVNDSSITPQRNTVSGLESVLGEDVEECFQAPWRKGKTSYVRRKNSSGHGPGQNSNGYHSGNVRRCR